MRFGQMFFKSREFSGLTQAQMAKAHNVSTKTIQSWEAGKTSPPLRESLMWFSNCGRNPMPYYFGYFHPQEYQALYQNPDMNDIDTALRIALSHATPVEKQIIDFLLVHTNGGGPSALLQLAVANLQTKLPYRVIVSNLIRYCYARAEEEGRLQYPNGPLPNISILGKATESGQRSAQNGSEGYTNVHADICVHELLSSSRTLVGKSQDYMAMSLNVSKRTVGSWEKGYSEPSFFDGIEWLRVLDLDPFQFLYSVWYKEGEVSDKEKISDRLNAWVSNAPERDRRALLYILAGRHGSSPYSYLQLTLAFVQLPLRDSVMIADTILRSYSMAYALDDIVSKDNIHPDAVELEEIVKHIITK